MEDDSFDYYFSKIIKMADRNCVPLLCPRNIAEYRSGIECLPNMRNTWACTDVDRLEEKHIITNHNLYLKAIYNFSNNTEKFYDVFKIRKNSGNYRTIHAPETNLKSMQYWIIKEILCNYPISKCAKAYRKGLSIVDNAAYHVDRPIVMKIDIEDFFGSIHFRRDYGESRHRKCIRDIFCEIYDMNIATILGKLCTLNGKLPQGAPSSPVLSNIVFFPLDKRIEAYCRYNGIIYTRYSDDLTFSGDFNPGKLLLTIKTILTDGGFRINHEKTRILRGCKRQQITGLVVNKKIRVPKDYKRAIRQTIYYINKYGIREHILFQIKNGKSYENKFYRNNRLYQKKYLHSLNGKIAYILMIEPKNIEFQKYKKYIGYLLYKKPLNQAGDQS